MSREPTEEAASEPTEEAAPEPTEEPAPEPTEEPAPEPTEEPAPEPTAEPTPEPQPTEVPTTPQILASGNIYPLDYQGEGQVALYRLPDGSHLLRLENLNLENGPDLRVYLVGIDPVPISVGTDAIAGYVDLASVPTPSRAMSIWDH